MALIYPVTDAGLNTPSMRDFKERYGLTAAGLQRYWNLYLDGADGFQPDASPLRADDLAGLPPTYVLTAEFDVLRDEGEAFVGKLREAGRRRHPPPLRRHHPRLLALDGGDAEDARGDRRGRRRATRRAQSGLTRPAGEVVEQRGDVDARQGARARGATPWRTTALGDLVIAVVGAAVGVGDEHHGGRASERSRGLERVEDVREWLRDNGDVEQYIADLSRPGR